MATIEPYSIRGDLIGVRVTSGQIEEGVIQVYEPDPADRILNNGIILRDGENYGTFIDRPSGDDYVTLFDRFTADPAHSFLTEGGADLVSSYTLSVNGSAQFHRWRMAQEQDR